MQHILCSKERGKRFVAWLMTAIMLLFVMASALPAAQAVTQDEIDDMKSQASSLKEQQADLQSKLDELENSQNAALDQKFLLEERTLHPRRHEQPGRFARSRSCPDRLNL